MKYLGQGFKKLTSLTSLNLLFNELKFLTGTSINFYHNRCLRICDGGLQDLGVGLKCLTSLQNLRLDFSRYRIKSYIALSLEIIIDVMRLLTKESKI